MHVHDPVGVVRECYQTILAELRRDTDHQFFVEGTVALAEELIHELKARERHQHTSEQHVKQVAQKSIGRKRQLSQTSARQWSGNQEKRRRTQSQDTIPRQRPVPTTSVPSRDLLLTTAPSKSCLKLIQHLKKHKASIYSSLKRSAICFLINKEVAASLQPLVWLNVFVRADANKLEGQIVYAAFAFAAACVFKDWSQYQEGKASVDAFACLLHNEHATAISNAVKFGLKLRDSEDACQGAGFWLGMCSRWYVTRLTERDICWIVARYAEDWNDLPRIDANVETAHIKADIAQRVATLVAVSEPVSSAAFGPSAQQVSLELVQAVDEDLIPPLSFYDLQQTSSACPPEDEIIAPFTFFDIGLTAPRQIGNEIFGLVDTSALSPEHQGTVASIEQMQMNSERYQNVVGMQQSHQDVSRNLIPYHTYNTAPVHRQRHIMNYSSLTGIEA